MGFGQHHPDDGRNQYQIGDRQPDKREPSEVATRLKQVRKYETGRDVKHDHDCDEQHLQREPFKKCGLQEDEYRSAADSEKSRRGGHSHIDESGQTVEPIEFGAVLDISTLPKQERQNDQSTRPD